MVTNPIRWTVRDLDVMPDDGGWKRYEIINGDLLVTRAPTFVPRAQWVKYMSVLKNGL